MLKHYMERRHEEEGFTLIELMVVVLIIGILIAIALPTFLGARHRAQDRAAQSDLRNGIAAAKTFFTDGDSYTGFDTAAGQAIEPSLDWTGGNPATVGQVSISQVSDTNVTLTEASASGAVFCITDDTTTGTVKGSVDASGATACTGAW